MVSEDIKDMLVSDSALGLIFKTNLFIAQEPSYSASSNLPVDVTTIFDTGGYKDELCLDGYRLNKPSVQIRVRNILFPVAMALAEQIKDFLYTQQQSIWNGTLYTFIVCVNGPYLLDFDENDNCRVVMNFDFIRTNIN
jgi:hypothetical protein